MSLERPVILTGFMGAGKSTLGPMLATSLEVPFHDTDKKIFDTTGRHPSDIINDDGEEYFRKIESNALSGLLLDKNPSVISTGGGIVTTASVRVFLRRATADVVWLDVPFEVAWQRIVADHENERPLAADVDAARRRFEQRQPWYRETAKFIIDATLEPDEIVDNIKSRLLKTRSQYYL